MTPSADDASCDERFAAVLAEYYRADAHDPVDRQQFAQDHAAWAERLWEHWRLADELRSLACAAGSTVRPNDDTAAKAQRLAPAAGERIGPYVLLAEIGRGGMGVVYRARQEPLGRLVAVKVMLAGTLAGATERRRFWVEAVAASRLRHEGIITVYDVGEQDAHQYIVMELVDGGTLHQRLQAAGPLPIADAARLIRDAARAVDHAHAAGIVHRDLKPSNVLLDASGRAKVGDFGLARTLESAASLTLTGEAIGTPSYMPPEQTSGPASEIGPRSDVYSLGATLFALLTGRPPFRGASALDTLWQVRMVAPPDARSLRGDVPRDLDTIVLKCLEKDPQQRYDSAAALADDLERFLDERPIAARRATRAERFVKWTRRHPRAFAAGALGLLATVVLLTVTTLVVAWSYRNERTARSESRVLAALAQNQVFRATPRPGGWRERALGELRSLGPIENTDSARTAAISTLIGLDATLEWEDAAQADVLSVAFDPAGTQFLLGGSGAAPAKLGRFGSNPQPIQSSNGYAVMAFLADGTPLEVVPAADDAPGAPDQQRSRLPISVWDLSRRSLLCQCDLVGQPTLPGPYELADEHRQPLLCCNPGATLIAAVVRGRGEPASTNFVAVWDGRTGRNLFLAEAPQAASLALADDGSLVACGGADGHVQVWDTRDRSKVELPGKRGGVLCLAFVPQAGAPAGGGPPSGLLVGGVGGFLQEWDLASRLPIQFFHGLPWDVTRAAIGPDGTTIAAAGRWTVVLWDRSTGTQLLRLPTGDVVTGLAWSPDGRRLVVGSRRAFSGGGASLWRFEDGRGIRTLRGLQRPVLIATFSPDGRQLAAVSQDGQVMIWDALSAKLKLALVPKPALSPDNTALAFSADGTRFAVCSGTEARSWRTADGSVVDTWPLPAGLADALAFLTNDSLVCVRAEGGPPAYRDVRFRLLDAGGSSTLVRSLPAFADRVAGTEITSDGSIVVVEGIDKSAGAQRCFLTAFDGDDASEMWSNDFGPEELYAALDASGRLVTLSAPGPFSLLLDLHTGRPAPCSDEVRQQARVFQGVSANAEYLLSLGFDSERFKGCSLFRRGRATPLAKLAVETTVSTIKPRFDSAGRRFAWGNADGTVLVAELEVLERELTRLGLGW